ncbi:site-specific integrase [Aquidulcibacter paucihalophilus]|nr:site-specific integrase [Aquidulcibacter paucihalophilus]
MAVMENVVRVGKTYKVRKRIPADCRAAFGVSGEFKTVSLNTTNKREAQERAVPILAEIDARIAETRGRALPPALDQRLNPGRVEELIRDWRFREIDRAYHDTYNGQRDNRDPIATSQQRYALQHYSTIDRIADFSARMASVLGVTPLHPVISRTDERERFRMAWNDVETFTARFPTDLTGWPEEQDAPLIPAPGPSTPATLAGMKLSELRDAWDGVKPLEARQKGYIRRLIEFLGDVDIATVQPLDMDRFLMELKRFPLTRKPSDEQVPFAALIAAYEGTDQARLHTKTIWNWTVVFKGMFAFAVSRRLLAHSPAAYMMKKPSGEEANNRNPYAEVHLDYIFTRPLFVGFSGPADKGYRDEPGENVVEDAKYWLPIVALHTGMRLEELASLKTSEIIGDRDVLAFDLRQRPLKGAESVKNASARRVIPVHKGLYGLGFVDWMLARADQQTHVFADLTTDGQGKRGSQFSKWWGLWCRANAETAREGIDDPSLTFHSFRHSFKRAARQSPVKEEVHDLLTGHQQGNSVARAYGAGVDLVTLKTAMDQIKIPWP